MPGLDFPTSMHHRVGAVEAFLHKEPSHDGLAEEVAALRAEIIALREALAPMPSLILTGREVVEQFKRMKW